MLDWGLIIGQLGPTGVLLALGAYSLKSLMPLVTAAVAHLGRIADATQQLTMALAALDKKIDVLHGDIAGVRGQLAEVAEDIAGLYAVQLRERPSRRPSRAHQNNGNGASS